MQSIRENEGARLMAQWLATGGAIEAQACEAVGDDGLSASPTRGYLCHVDDGLKAMQFTTPMHPYARCSGDDGLAAVQFTVASGGGICGDDGLKAAEMTMPSASRPCFGIDAGEDGLQAGSVTGMHIPGVCGDDGLAAVQFTTPMHPYARCSGDDGLAAVQFTTPMHPYARCSGDDGLAAMQYSQGHDRGSPACRADDGLQAGSVTGMHIPGVCAGDGLVV